jgi:hypothetical protein
LGFDFWRGLGVDEGFEKDVPGWEDEIGGDGSDVLEEAFSGALGGAGFDT